VLVALHHRWRLNHNYSRRASIGTGAFLVLPVGSKLRSPRALARGDYPGVP
jgi:hypothetical protein